MKLLALESSSLVASAALLDGEIITAEYTTNFKKTHSQTLLPMVDEIVRMTETDLNDLDAIAVSAGPGSFTGLRIGAATAKGLCLALGKPLIPVPTLEAMIYGIGGEVQVCPIMDARRNQVYTFLNGKSCAMDMGDLIEALDRQCGPAGRVIFVGDGIPVYRAQIEEQMQTPHDYAPAHCNRQRAAAVAAWAARYGTPMDADTFAPEYLRKSQAERERDERSS